MGVHMKLKKKLSYLLMLNSMKKEISAYQNLNYLGGQTDISLYAIKTARK